MPWVLDERAQRLRDAALRELRQAADELSYLIGGASAIEGHARTALGPGHWQGDQIINSATQGIAACQRARTAIGAAISELGNVDVTEWQDDPQ